MSLSFIEQRGHHLLHLEAVLRPRRLLSTSNFVRLEIATEFFIMSAEQSWTLEWNISGGNWEQRPPRKANLGLYGKFTIPCTCVGIHVVLAVRRLGTAMVDVYWRGWEWKYRNSSCPHPRSTKRKLRLSRLLSRRKVSGKVVMIRNEKCLFLLLFFPLLLFMEGSEWFSLILYWNFFQRIYF